MAHTDKVFPLETTQSTTALALKTTLVTVLRFMWQEENSISQTESAKSSSGKRPASPQVTRGGKKRKLELLQRVSVILTTRQQILGQFHSCGANALCDAHPGCFVGQANYSALYTRRDLQTCHFTENSNKADIVHFKNPWSINGVESLCKHITKDLFSELRDALPDTWQLIATNPQGLCNPG